MKTSSDYEWSSPHRGDLSAEEMVHLLLPLLQEVSELSIREDVGGQPLLGTLLSELQRFLGCQGIGIFTCPAGEWSCAVGLGGRSLGSPPAEWLTEIAESGKTGFLSDYPAADWGQIGFSVRCDLVQPPEALLVLSARNPETLPRTLLPVLIPLLEQLFRLAAHRWAEVRSRHKKNQRAEREQVLSRIAAFPHFLQDLELLLRQDGDDLQLALVCGNTSQHSPTLLLRSGAETVEVLSDTSGFRLSADVSDPLIEELVGALQRDERGQVHWTLVPLPPIEAPLGNCFLMAYSQTDLQESVRQELQHFATLSACQLQRDLLEQQRQWTSRLLQDHGETELLPALILPAPIAKSVQELRAVRLPVLLEGEPGTGKAQVARHLHSHSGGSAFTFLSVPCRAMTETQMQFLLAPQTRPSFPWAEFYEMAHLLHSGGTLLLKNIGDLSMEAQTALLGFLRQQDQPASAQPLGLRLVSTTDKPVEELIAENKLIPELLQRLSVIHLAIPPLRERKEHLIALFEQMLQRFASHTGVEIPQRTQEADQFLLDFHWPGNLPQLKELCRKLMQGGREQPLTVHDMHILLQSGEWATTEAGQVPTGLTDATFEFQRQHIRQAIARCRGNMTEAARALDLHRSNLYRKMHQLNMAEADNETPEVSDSSDT